MTGSSALSNTAATTAARIELLKPLCDSSTPPRNPIAIIR